MADIHSAIRASVDHWVLYKCPLPDSLKEADSDAWSCDLIDSMCRSRIFEHIDNVQQEIWIEGSTIYLDIQVQFKPELVECDLLISKKCLSPGCGSYPMIDTRWCSIHQMFKGNEDSYQLIRDEKIKEVQASVDQATSRYIGFKRLLVGRS